MSRNPFHSWLGLTFHAVAVALLMSGAALAQAKPDAGKKEEPKADAPQSSAEKQADKPGTGPATQKEQGAPRQDQAAPRQDQSSQQRDQSTQGRDQTSPRSTDRSDTSRQSERQSQGSARDSSQRDSSRDPARSDRSTQRSTDRTDRDATRDRRDTQQDRGTQRDRSTLQDRSTQRDRSTDTSKRSEKQIKAASDLGFSFSKESTDKGLKVSKLSSRSIASKADFKEGDIIISINDHRLRSEDDFLHWIHAGRHDRITVIVLRDDREVTLYLEPDVIFEETVVAQGGAWLGVDLYDRFSRMAVVLKVHPNSPAERAGLRSDDLIVAVEGEEIRSPEHLGEVIGRMRPGDQVEIEVERNRRAQFVDATLAQRETVTRRTESFPRPTLLPRR